MGNSPKRGDSSYFGLEITVHLKLASFNFRLHLVCFYWTRSTFGETYLFLMTLFGGKSPRKPSLEDVIQKELEVLYRIGVRLCRNSTEAEDLVAQTLYLAAKSWDKFDGQFPRSYLIKILRNEFYGRGRKTESPTISLEATHEASDEGYWQAIDWSLVGKDILVKLDELPEDYRLAVFLCDVEGMTRDEAALALEMPVGTINSRLHRGRNMLRSKLALLLGELVADA